MVVVLHSWRRAKKKKGKQATPCAADLVATSSNALRDGANALRPVELRHPMASFDAQRRFSRGVVVCSPQDITSLAARHFSAAHSYKLFAWTFVFLLGLSRALEMAARVASIVFCFLLWPCVAHAESVGDGPSFMMVSGISSSEEMCVTAADGARSTD